LRACDQGSRSSVSKIAAGRICTLRVFIS
jgi:hypothetical protein